MSSAASISAAKRRRGPQPGMQASGRQNVQSNQQANVQKANVQQANVQQGRRINPMAILENHELRLREIESKSTETSNHNAGIQVVPQTQTVPDVKIQELEGSNRELNAKIEIMKNKIISLESQVVELSKLKEIVFTLQSAVMRNTQKVETYNSSVSEVNKTGVVNEVSQELEDVTKSMDSATIAYGEDSNKPANITFSVVDNSKEEEEVVENEQ